MKKLLAIIILSLCFITPSQADDIREFQIEGMSIGDSLLNYMSEKDLKSSPKNWHKGQKAKIYKDKKYAMISKKIDRGDPYELIIFDFRDNDKDYLIKGIAGLSLANDFDMCLKKKEIVVSELKKVFKNKAKYENRGILPHPIDKSGLSVSSWDIFFINDKSGIINIECQNFKNVPNNYFKVSIISEEFNQFLLNKAY